MNSPELWCHSAFYAFVPVSAPAHWVEVLRRLGAGLSGSVIVAPEGLSGAVAGPEAEVQAFEQALRRDPCFGDVLAGMVFKRSWSRQAPFGRLKVQARTEIVAFGVDGVTGVAERATHLAPSAWRALLQQPGLVLLDNRNSFEYRLGHFRQAIDPQVDNFRDFAEFVRREASAWRAAGRPVAMYCTGGIRCEKTSAWMQQQGLQVWQLDGGVLNYFQSLPDADRDWQGDCFVFDNRLAIDTRLQPVPLRPEQVYLADRPDEAWRLARAQRLAAAAA